MYFWSGCAIDNRRIDFSITGAHNMTRNIEKGVEFQKRSAERRRIVIMEGDCTDDSFQKTEQVLKKLK